MGAFMGGLLGSAVGFILIFIVCAFTTNKNNDGSNNQ